MCHVSHHRSRTPRCSAQQQRHERPFESLHESPQEDKDEDEDDAGDGGNEKAEDDENDAETDRVAKELMDNTALEPSPPPAAAVAGGSGDGGAAAIDMDVPEGADRELGKDKLLDGDSTLGGMISPRPAEQGNQYWCQRGTNGAKLS